MQPVTHPADIDDPGQHLAAPAFVRVAVLCRLPQQGPRWASAAGDALAARLVADGLTHFDYFPVDFTSAQADEQIAQAFALVRADRTASTAAGGGREYPFDTIVVAGGADLESDIGAIHRVLAPGMRAAGLPVLCALGADDASTILGDSAWRVFADPLQMLESIAAAVRPAGPSIEALCEQIRSLAGFFLTEHEIEARILLDAAIGPAARKQVARHEQECEDAARTVKRAVEGLQLRLVREAGQLEQARARLGVELTRAQQRGERRGRFGLGVLRIGVLLFFIAVVVALWLLTSPATTVFFSGCALVLLSAAYVAASNRIAERDAWHEAP